MDDRCVCQIWGVSSLNAASRVHLKTGPSPPVAAKEKKRLFRDAMSNVTALPMNFCHYLGRFSIGFISELGALTIFSFYGVALMFSIPVQIKKTVQQVFFIGVKSIFVILLVSVFTGMVLGLQGYYTLVKFGSEGLLGAAVSLSLIRELGPVLTAIMITARAGSAMAAEIGIMRISEQIDALETMSISPLRFLVSPRIAAGLISFPLLTAIFDVIGIFGGYAIASGLLPCATSLE